MKFKFAFIFSVMVSQAFASDLQFNFNSPAFNGSGYTSHVTSVYQLEQSNKQKIRDEQSLANAQAAAKAASDPINQFVMTLNSMVYQKLSQEVTDSIFGTGGNAGNVSFGTTTISWFKNNDGTVTVNTMTPNGTTQLIIPTTTFVQ
jgi:hypothetical protein